PSEPDAMLLKPIIACTDPESVAFEFENSRTLLRHWQGLRVNGAVPRADAIDPASMKELLPEIVIYDLPDLATVRYRLAGTLAVRRLGFEPRGTNLVDFATPEMRSLVTLAFNVVARSYVGLVSHFRLVHDGGVPARMEMLFLPLLPPAGEPPRIISLISREKLPPELTRYGIDYPPEAIDDACMFDLGFGLPDLSMIPGLGIAA
ncbi:MAG TPA: PAS domain-containing protein, partial [Parvibaculum sp.]